MSRTALQSRRNRTSCSIIALATVMAVGATPAWSQSFNGTGLVTTGSGSITTSANTTNVAVSTQQTVIKWSPTDTATNTTANIVFQNSGTTANFTGPTGFAVLNNINLDGSISRAIEMNGTVNSAGSVYFYSPGGFVFGGSSVFNVAGLVASALPIQMTGSTFMVGPDRTVTFGQAPNPNAAIVMNGRVNAFTPALGFGGNGPGYVGIIAPKVVQNGGVNSIINTNGSTALVAAEQATLSFSPDGLFDIQVTVGSTSSSGIEVYGNIGGESPTDATDQQRVFLVGVAKNSAMTMVIGGGADLGFELAGSASVDDNGAVILSAGHDISGGLISDESAAAGGVTNVWFTGAHATNNLFAEVNGYINLYSTDAQASQLTTIFDNDVTVHADDHVWMTAAGAGTSLTVGGNLSLSTNQYSDFSGGTETGGQTEIYALNGGQLSVTGTTILSADGFGGTTESSGATGGTGTGGRVLIQGSGGNLTFGGNVTATADGYGGDSFSGNGGAGIGGTQANNSGGVHIIADSGGAVTFNGTLDASASGFGGEAYSAGTTSGTGTGGDIFVSALTGGDISVAGMSRVNAEGRGGTTWDNGADGGDGTGGAIYLNVGGVGSTLSLTGGVFSANGEGGGPGEGNCCVAIGGDGFGGKVSVGGSTGGLITSAGTLEFSAAGSGGYGSVSGGNGHGGDDEDGNGVWVDAQSGMTISVIGGDLALDATGSGGDGGAQAGNGTGGYAALYMNGGTVSATADVNVDADGFGGDSDEGGDAGNGTGGFAQVVGAATSSITAGGRLLVEADGTGGETGSDGSTGSGGVGTGGTAGMFANNGTLTVNGDVEMSAYGQGGDATYSDGGALGDGGDAFGGITRVTANLTGDVLITGALDMNASATGGAGVNGGDATGMFSPSTNEGLPTGVGIYALANGSSLTVQGLSTLDVSATGGDATTGNGGAAQGGEIDIIAQAGDISLADVDGTTDGTGGAGGFGGGTGGNGSGGAIDVAWALGPVAIDGSITIGSADLTASGYGGAGGEGTTGATGGNGGAGGSGSGGGIFYIGNAAGGIFDAGATTLLAVGTGGAGGNGGTGSVGAGGNGGIGGQGTGGFIQTGNVSSEGNPGSGGTTTYTTLVASVSASGGAGGSGGEGASGTGLGGDGGDAVAGSASFLARGIVVEADLVNLAASAQGGNGGFGSTDGDGGDATTGWVRVESKDRFGHPTERGTLNVGSIFAVASAEGGSGDVDGASIVHSNSYFQVSNGDANIGTLNFNISGTSFDDPTRPDYILADRGTATIGSFSFSTTGPLAVYTTATGLIDVTGSMSLIAGNFVDYPAAPEPLVAGTLRATNLSIVSGGDFYADANIDAANGIDIAVPGLIRFDNASSDAHVDLWAQGGSIDVGNVTTDGYATLIADDNVNLLDVDAGGSVNIQSLTGSIGFGDMLAGSVFLSAAGAIGGGSVQSSGNVIANAGNDISLQDVTSTFGLISLAAGDDLSLGGDLLADGDILLTASGDILMNNATTHRSITIDGGGYVDGDDLTAGDAIDIEAAGWVDLGNLSAGLVNPDTDEGSEQTIKIVALGNIVTGDLSAASHIGLATPGTMTTGDIDAGGVFTALGHGDMIFGDATAAEVFLADYQLLVLGNVITGSCVGECGTTTADGVVTTPPSGPFYSYVTTAGGAEDAPTLGTGDETNGSLYSTSTFDASAGDSLDFWFNYVTSDGSGYADYAWAGLYTSNLEQVAILFTARTQPSGTIVPGQNLPGVEATLNPASVPIIDGAPVWSPLGESSGSCFSAGCGYTGWVNSTYEITTNGSYVLRIGVTNWSDTSYQSGLAFGGLTIAGAAVGPLLTPTGGSITIGDVNTGKFSAAAGTNLTTGIVNSGGSIDLGANGAISTGDLTAGDFVLANAGSIATGNIDADSVDMTSTGGSITTGDIFALGDVALSAFTDVTTGDILAGSIDLAALNDITTGDLSTQLILQLADAPITALLFPGASITLEAGGDILTGDISSIDGVYADAGGSLTTGMIDAFDFVELYSGGNMQTGAIDAGSYIYAESGAGISVGTLEAGADITLDAIGNAAFVSAQAGGEFDFSVGGSLTGGNVIAGAEIGGEAGGSITLGNLTAGLPLDDDFSVGLLAANGITVGNVNATGPVGFATTGNLVTGNIVAGVGVLALVGGNVTMGSITTSGETGGQVYIGDDSMFFAAGGTPDGEGDFDVTQVLAVDPVPTGGSITINGPVTTGLFQAAAGTSLTAQAITAGEIDARAVGTANVNGLWSAPLVTLASSDINITQTGGIAAGAGGEVNLLSSNTQRMSIGDGLANTGYALSNAEFGRVSGGSINIIAGGFPNAAADTLIGDLTVTVGENGNIRSAEGGLAIVGLSESGTERDGTMRVVGDVVGTGFGSDNYLAFATEHFELDAAAGSIALTSTGTNLSGELGIYADTIHVAELPILLKLEANPTYAGYQDDLNKGATTQRPDGVLRADTLWIESENLQDILIQNMGTGGPSGTFAGFVVRQAFVNDDFETTGPAGSINLVVSGQLVTEGGTLTGVAVRDALVEGEDLSAFTSNSTINGCPLTGQCIIKPPAPPPVADIVDNQIDLIFSDPLGDSDFGNEQDIDDNAEGDEGASNPISPPQPLFDTRPLIPSSEIDDPVSGTGNPALVGSDQCENQDANGQCPVNPVKGENQ